MSFYYYIRPPINGIQKKISQANLSFRVQINLGLFDEYKLTEDAARSATSTGNV